MKQSDRFSRARGAVDSRGPAPWWAVAPSVAWVVGIVLVTLVLAAAVTVFTVPVKRSVEISGIVFPHNGIESVKSRRDGVVSSLQVKVGELVEAGDLIAIIPDTLVLEEIEAARGNGASRQELEVLYGRYQAGSMIYTPIAGRVVELAEQGERLGAGDTVAGITNADHYTNESEIRAYVPIGAARSISKGMEVRVRPQYSAPGQHGYLPGLVSDISDYPVTQADISRELGRFYSSDTVPQEGNIVEIRVTLLLDPEAAQIGWNGAGGEGLTLDVSTLCAMEVIIAEQTAWEWLFG